MRMKKAPIKIEMSSCNLVQTLDMLSSHASIYGDGIKRIVLLLHYLMKRINRPHFLPEAETKWRCELLRQVNLFRHHILPGLIQNLYMNYSGVQFELSNIYFIVKSNENIL